jgi:hypothetical protein
MGIPRQDRGFHRKASDWKNWSCKATICFYWPGACQISQSLAGLRDAPNQNLKETIPRMAQPAEGVQPRAPADEKVLPRGFSGAPTVDRKAHRPGAGRPPGCSWVHRQVRVPGLGSPVGILEKGCRPVAFHPH